MSPHLDIPKPLQSIPTTHFIESYPIAWLNDYTVDDWDAYLVSLTQHNDHAARLWYIVMRWLRQRNNATAEQVNAVLNFPVSVQSDRCAIPANKRRVPYLNYDDSIWIGFIMLATSEGTLDELIAKHNQFRQKFYADPANATRLASVGRGTSSATILHRNTDEPRRDTEGGVGSAQDVPECPRGSDGNEY